MHLYAKYMSEQDRQRLKQSLEQRDFNVSVNTLGFPASVEATTLLYSLLLKNSQDIETVTGIAASQGISVTHIRSLTEGNHWYTKNSLALFVLPDNFTGVLRPDLLHTFLADKCSHNLNLTLNNNGTFNISEPSEPVTGKTANNYGSWHYRQPPYLELRYANGRDFSYYQIHKRSESDIVSAMQVVRLIPLQGIIQAPQCELMYAERIL